MPTWLAIFVAFMVGTGVGYLVSEKISGDKQLAALTDRVNTLEAPRAQPPLPQRAAPPAQRRLTDVSIAGSPIRGPVNAPVTIIEFSDFQCPFCSRVNATLLKLLATYPDTVRLIFKHTPLPMHPDSVLAHRASIAADRQGRFWEMHDLIFTNIRDVSRGTLITYAQDLELDVAQFTRDLDSEALIAELNKDMAESRKLGINGTPTFIINGNIVSGAQPFENFQALVERELARGQKQGGSE